MPERPARPVRPARWMYDSSSRGGEHWMTRSTSAMSSPLYMSKGRCDGVHPIKSSIIQPLMMFTERRRLLQSSIGTFHYETHREWYRAGRVRPKGRVGHLVLLNVSVKHLGNLLSESELQGERTDFNEDSESSVASRFVSVKMIARPLGPQCTRTRSVATSARLLDGQRRAWWETLR
jgi:hypothetical protein